MESVGARLRAARLARGMSIQDVAQVTKIPRTSVEAIEDDRFSVLPAPVFARGFVRSIATALGLDPLELARDLPESIAASEGAPPPGGRGGEGVGPMLVDGYARGGFRSSYVLLILVAIGMLVVAWLMVGTRPGHSDETAGQKAPILHERVDGVSSFTDAHQPR